MAEAKDGDAFSAELYCICKQPYSAEDFMIECNKCGDWFHGRCVGIEEAQATDIDVYHCPKCQKVHGPLILKPKRTIKRHNYRELNDGSKVIRAGTVMFIRQLKARKFLDGNEVVKMIDNGHEFTVDMLMRNGFCQPMIVKNKSGLGIKLPKKDFSVYDVETHVGSMCELHVIDVLKQEDLRMKMREWTEYYNCPVRTKVLNVISLEFSHTTLNDIVEAPQIVRDISWVENVWPEQIPEESPLERPYVQKYCLMGVKDSYTDFHVDFGGTSVWYHVLRGEKIFYLIEPTKENLIRYENWVTSSDQSQVFFGDIAKKCYKCHVKQGNTLFIPSGWIHAVLTPMDSLVFGGNFLHSFNVPLQLEIYKLEKRLSTPIKFLFPNYETTNWYAGMAMLTIMREYHGLGLRLPPFLLRNVNTLLELLKGWTTAKKDEFFKFHKFQVPIELNHVKLLKSISKELKNDEKYYAIANDHKSMLSVCWSDEARDRLKDAKKTVLKISLKSNDGVAMEPATNLMEGRQSQPIKMTLPKMDGKDSKRKRKNAQDETGSVKLIVSNGRIVSNQSSSGREPSGGGFQAFVPSADRSIKLKLNVTNFDRNDVSAASASHSMDSQPHSISTTSALFGFSPKHSTTTDTRGVHPVASVNQPHTIVMGEIEEAKHQLFRQDIPQRQPLLFSPGSSAVNPHTSKQGDVNDADDDGGYYHVPIKPSAGPRSTNRKKKVSDEDSDYDPSQDSYYQDADFVYPRMDISHHLDDDDCSWRPGQKRGKKAKKDSVHRKSKLNSPSSNRAQFDQTDSDDDLCAQQSKASSGTGFPGNSKSKDAKRIVSSSTAKQRLGKLLKLDKLGSRYIRK